LDRIGVKFEVNDRKKGKDSLNQDLGLDPDPIQGRGRGQGRGPVREEESGHEDRLHQHLQEVHRVEEQVGDLILQVIHDPGPDHCQYQARQVIRFVGRFVDTKRPRLQQRPEAKRTTVFLLICSLRLHRIP